MRKPSHAGLAVPPPSMLDDADSGAWISRELSRVEEANLEFYEAFSARDIDRMTRVWAKSPHARCIHPGWEAVVGWTDIRNSWVEIFRTIANVEFELEDVHIEVSGRMAWANLVAHLQVTTDEGEEFLATVVATNIFELAEDHWRMVLHHSSNFADDDGEIEEEPTEQSTDPEHQPN